MLNRSGRPDEPGTMRTTPLPLVLALFVLGGAVGWSAVAVIQSTGGTVARPPWLAVGALALFAGLLLAGAWYMYDRVHRKGQRVDPLYAFRLLVLGKAGALVGALVGGGYAGVALRFAGDLGYRGSATGKVVTAGAAALAGIAIVVAAMLLERACKRPKDELEREAEERDEPDA